ncbi:MAG: septum formation initiator family protein [Peptococcaceae bacterium]|nr:septum formation initiator family protein [Peptococcaceae bacterium]
MAPGGARLVLVVMVLAGFLVGVLITYYYSRVFALGYQISRLEKELALLRVENHSLDEEIHRLASLDRVEFLAVNKLGMVKPDSSNVLVVAVAGNAPPQPEQRTGQAAAAAGAEKSRLIRTFTELVNRLESKIWLGQGPGEGTDANDQYYDPEKNNRTVSYNGAGAPRADLPPGLASAC